jgi:hypothetical protein
MQPVFVCGVRGSGTRLLLSLLSGHSQLFVTLREDGLANGLARATEEFREAIRKSAVDKLYRALHYHTEVRSFAGTFRHGSFDPEQEQRSFPFRLSAPIDVAGFEGAFTSRLVDPAGDRLRVRSLADLVAAFYETLADQCEDPHKSHLVAKPTAGVDVFLEAEAHFRQLRPRLLCLVRDPRAVIHAQLQGDPGLSTSALARGWLEHLRAMAELRKHYPIQAVSYEGLCQKRGEVMRSIAAFLRIPFEEELTQLRLFDHPHATDPAFGPLEADGTTRSLERWRDDLTPRQLRRIETVTSPALAQAGYTPEVDRPVLLAMGRIGWTWHRWSRIVQGKLLRSRFRLAVAALSLGILVGLCLGWLMG